MGQVIFTGDFQLDQALADFGRFANAIEARLKKLSEQARQAGKSGGAKTPEQDLKERQEAEDKLLKKKIQVAEKENQTRARLRAAEQKEREREAEREQKRQQKITDQMLAYNIASAKKYTTEQEKLQKEAARRLEKFFAGFTVGGFALQRFGQFLQQSISEPLKGVIAQLYETTIAVNDFEETLKTRGGRSVDEIEEIYQVIKRVSDLPNLQREDILTIFSRLEEVTQGGLTARELEKIGQGLSKITTSLEAGEKRAFYGQLQDILGGGDVANLEKTLSLVPLLKSKFDELKAAASVDNSDSSPRTLILQALTDLSVLPNIDNIATSVKKLSNELFEIRRRIGNVYKDELKGLIDFIVRSVFPTIEHLLTMFEQAGQAVHTFVAALAGMALILPPLISVIGAFAIAIGGIGFAITEFKFAFGSFGAVFGAGGGIATFFTGLTTTILPRLLALLGPIGIALTVVVGAFAKAFSTNAGGFADALGLLASSILPAIGNFLLNIYHTLTSIVDLLSTIYNLIDFLGTITTTFGVLGTILAYILTTAIQITNALSLIPAGLTFLSDILSGNADLAFARFNVAILKLIQSVTVLGQLFEVIFGVDLGKVIANAENEVEKLDLASKGMHKTAQSEAELTKQKTDALNKSYKESQQTIIAITEAIKSQTKAIDDNSLKARENASSRYSSLRAEMAQRSSAILGETQFDLSSTEGIANARKTVGEQRVIELNEASRQARERTQKELRATLTERRNEFLKMAEKEISQDTKLVYEQYAELLKLTIQDPNIQITPDFLEETVFKNLTKTVAKGGLKGASLELLMRQLAGEKIIIQQVYKAQLENVDEVSKAQGLIAERERKLQKDIDEQNRKDEVALLSTPFIQNNLIQDSKIARNREALQRSLEIAKTTLDLAESSRNIAKYHQQLLDAEKKRYENLVALDKLELKSAAEHKAAQDKLKTEFDITVIDINDTVRKGKTEVADSISKDVYESAEELIGLQRMLVDKMSTSQQLATQLEALGAGSSTAITDTLNGAIDTLFTSIVSIPVDKLYKATSVLTDRAGGLPAGVEGLKDVFEKFKKMSAESLVDPTKRKAMIDQAESIVKTIQMFLAGDALGKDKDTALQLQIVLNQYIELLKTVKENEGLLTSKISQKEKDLQVDELRLGNQQELNDAIRENLELELEILRIRQERGFDLDDEKSIIGQIWATISGSRQAIIKAQEKIIENQRKAAQLEMDIALNRLAIEQLILETKMRELGMSEEEIQKSRDLYEQQVEQIKRKAVLQQEILDEQMAKLKDYSGGILDIIFQAISDGMTKKKEKKNEDYTGIIDDAGNVTDEDGGVFGAGDPEEEMEDVGDAASTMGDKMEKARKMALGLGKALLNLDDISLKSIAKVLAAELKALQAKATVKALEYAAIAISAAVFGDWGKAAKAAAAAAAWTGVAVAAGAASKWLSGKADSGSAQNSQTSKSQAAGDTESEREKQILRQKALSVFIKLDIRTDDGIIIEKNIRALNQNTELTTLTSNSADGWLVSPAP